MAQIFQLNAEEKFAIVMHSVLQGNPPPTIFFWKNGLSPFWSSPLESGKLILTLLVVPPIHTGSSLVSSIQIGSSLVPPLLATRLIDSQVH